MAAMAMRGGAALAAMLVAAVPAAADAQAVGNAAAPAAATPTPAAAALPVPPPPVIALPTPQPSASPTRSASPRPTPTAATAKATPGPTPRPAATAAAPAAAPSPPPPPPSPTVSLTPAAVVAPPIAPATADTPASTDYALAALAAGVLAAAALVWVLLRRRRADPAEAEQAYDEGRLAEVPLPVDPLPDRPPPDRSPPPGPSYLDRSAPPARARLTLGFRPVRAGLNLLSATSENEITIANDGDAPADDIRLQLRLVSAHAGLDAELAAIAADPIGRPVTPPFALQPGERRVVTAIGALPREAIQVLTAAGRPMFVPVVALALAWRSDGDEHLLTQAFAIGVERVDSAKLAPFWLDGPARSYDQVAARPHGPVLER